MEKNETRVLIVIDMQNDFTCQATGSLYVSDPSAIFNQIRDNFEHVIFTQDWHPKDHISFSSNHPGYHNYDKFDTGLYTQVLFPDHCVQDSPGAELNKNLVRKEGDIYVKKGTKSEIDSYSCFFDIVKSSKTEAQQILEKIHAKTLYFMGVATDFCVKSSVVDALELGYEVYVIEDGISGVSAEDSAAAVKLMKEKGAKFVKSSDINF